MNSTNFLCTDYEILIVDGQQENRAKAYNVLFPYGVSVDEAEDEAAALRLIRYHRYDMILIGEAPAASGSRPETPSGTAGVVESVLTEAKNQKYAPVVIVFLQEETPEDAALCQKNGACATASYPYREEELAGLLEEWIPEKRKLSLPEQTEAAFEAETAGLFMTGVDVVSAVKRNLGIENYLDLLEIFYIDGQKRIPSLDQNIADKDFRNYIIQVHGLKSSAANIGADALSAMAKQHEASGNESDYAYIESHREELFTAYRAVLSEIERVLTALSYGQFAKTNADSLTPIDPDGMLLQIRQALSQLEAFRSREAAETVKELLTHAVPDTVRKALTEIAEHLKMYEDDAAEQKLHELLNA